MRYLINSVLFLAGVSGALPAQQPTYVPSTQLPNGKEIVAIYLGAQSCGPCHFQPVKDGVVRMKELVAAQAKKSGAAFSVIGVANDWDHALAASFLASVGPFDQVVLGGNWTNLAIESFVWRDPQGSPAMPQIIIIERTVATAGRITISEPRVLRRVLGAEEIPAWIAKGAPISREEPAKK
jgi:hypothetical protein